MLYYWNIGEYVPDIFSSEQDWLDFQQALEANLPGFEVSKGWDGNPDTILIRDSSGGTEKPAYIRFTINQDGTATIDNVENPSGKSGLGSQMVANVMSGLKDKGIEEVKLHAHAGKATGFWAKLGAQLEEEYVHEFINGDSGSLIAGLEPDDVSDPAKWALVEELQEALEQAEATGEVDKHLLRRVAESTLEEADYLFPDSADLFIDLSDEEVMEVMANRLESKGAVFDRPNLVSAASAVGEGGVGGMVKQVSKHLPLVGGVAVVGFATANTAQAAADPQINGLQSTAVGVAGAALTVGELDPTGIASAVLIEPLAEAGLWAAGVPEECRYGVTVKDVASYLSNEENVAGGSRARKEVREAVMQGLSPAVQDELLKEGCVLDGQCGTPQESTDIEVMPMAHQAPAQGADTPRRG